MAEASVTGKQARSDFWWLFSILSALLSTLAIVALARHAFVTWSLSAPLALVMDAYNATMRLLFGWAQPYLQAVLTWLSSFFGWRPTLYPHWRDVFVLMALLSIGIVRGFQRQHQQQADDIPWRLATIGAVGTLIAALAVGVQPLQPLQSGHKLEPMVVAFVPAFAMVCQAAALQTVLRGLMSMSFMVVGMLPSGAVMLGLVEPSTPGVGLILLAASVASVGAAFLLLGAYGALVTFSRPRFLGRSELPLLSYMWRGWLVTGLTILGGFVGAALFFAIDAGLKLLGT